MQLISIEDLAVYLGDSKRTIYKYIASGDCPPYIRISAKNIKFDRTDVDAWLESKKVMPEPNSECWPRGSLPWTPRAKRVMKLAEDISRRYKLDRAGTGEMLLGIVEVKDCLGAGILRNFGVDHPKVRELYERLYEETKAEVKNKASGEKSNLANDAQKAIRCAREQAVRWGHEYVGAEHLLVGILLAGEGLGHRILTELGITLDKVRAETAKLIVCRPGQKQ
ncbi:MAG TPA: Clp protease N-terminal domain-containing protein [Sedimentisphaerales bacterium]|nr:Clp protease N-terminal domain-containing protein [Sedimentisphaerales bacterium]